MRSRPLISLFAFWMVIGFEFCVFPMRAVAMEVEEPDFPSESSGQIEYGKKFYPSEKSRSYFLEINPLLLFSRSLVLESEIRGGENFTYGIDFRYKDAVVHDSGGVKGTHTYIGLSPKLRLYPLPILSGVFVGVKVFMGQVRSTIDSIESKTWDEVLVSPLAHVGYRITSNFGLTLALYIGGGFNVPALDISDSEFPGSVVASAEESARWRDASEALNQQESRFKPDIGLSLGVAF